MTPGKRVPPMSEKTPRTKTVARRLYSHIAPRILPPLPRISAPPKHGPLVLTITTIHVYDKPWFKGGAGTQWIVASKPTRAVGEDDLVCLTANFDRRTGTGRLSHITNMDKHWITFGVAGAIPKTGIRVPVPWAKLPIKIAGIHAKLLLSRHC